MTTEVLAPTAVRGWLDRPATYTIAAPILTLLGAATTVLAPRLLEPAQFGQFVLLVSVFQYVSEFDLGLSRLTDRAMALPPGQRPDCTATELLWSRLWIAGTIWITAVVVSRWLGQPWSKLTLIAVSGGVMFMVSNGPVAIYRASGRIGEFTTMALSMQFGLGLPRLLGLLMAGIKGCFVALAAWYLVTAVVFTTRASAGGGALPAPSRVARLIVSGLPLFLFSTSWSLYLLANRWIASLLVSPVETGLFGFGVTLVTVGVGVIGTIAQVHYPKHLAGAARGVLAREMGGLLAISTAAIGVGVWGCRELVPYLFPNFVAGAAAAAALLVAAVPLALCSWLVPLAVATAAKPWQEAPAIFGASLALLIAAMVIGSKTGGIVTLAWCCLPSSFLLLTILAQRLVRSGLLDAASSRKVLVGTACAVLAGGAEWLSLFH
jgi:O-antigen/teichoic acid export membrane protein